MSTLRRLPGMPCRLPCGFPVLLAPLPLPLLLLLLLLLPLALSMRVPLLS